MPRPYGRNGAFAKKAVDESLPDAVGAFVDWLLKESGWKVTERERPGEALPISARHVCLLFRRFGSLVFSVAIFWFTAGGLLDLVLQGAVLGLTRDLLTLLFIQQVLNGIANAQRLQSLLAPYREAGACPVRVTYRNGDAEADLTLPDAWRVRLGGAPPASPARWPSPQNVPGPYS